METPANSTKTPFSEVNKRINAFWEVHIQNQKFTKNFTKNVCVQKNDSKLFIYVIDICLLYVYITSVFFVYSLFILFNGSHTTQVSMPVSNDLYYSYTNLREVT